MPAPARRPGWSPGPRNWDPRFARSCVRAFVRALASGTTTVYHSHAPVPIPHIPWSMTHPPSPIPRFPSCRAVPFVLVFVLSVTARPPPSSHRRARPSRRYKTKPTRSPPNKSPPLSFCSHDLCISRSSKTHTRFAKARDYKKRQPRIARGKELWVVSLSACHIKAKKALLNINTRFIALL